MPPFLRGSTAIVQRASSTAFSVQRTPRPADSPVFDTGLTLAHMFAQVATLVPIPAVSVAATALISVLDAYTCVQANRDRCFRLSQRAFTILYELKEAMEGKWDDAPPALLESVVKFSHVLLSLRDAMKQIASASVARRILSGSKFSGLLDDHERCLQDMQASFQLTSMVAVQYGLHMQVGQLLDIRQAVLSNQSHGSSVSKDVHGFRRYHQSAVQLQRTNNRALGWFSGTSEGIVDGQKVLVKTYSGHDITELKQQWEKEVKMLQRLFHANLPHLIGYSDDETPNPFILLENVPTYEYTSYIHDLAQTRKSDMGVHKVVQAAKDVFSAASFIAQNLSFDKSQICLFIQNSTFVVNGKDHNVIVGLPDMGKDTQLHPVAISALPSWPVDEEYMRRNHDLIDLIVAKVVGALERKTFDGQYHRVPGYLSLAIRMCMDSGKDGLAGFPPRYKGESYPFEFIMNLPARSQLGDIGYFTTNSPAFTRLFNVFDRDPTAQYVIDELNTSVTQDGYGLGEMSTPIFHEEPFCELTCLGERTFSNTVHFPPPISGTTRRILSLSCSCRLRASRVDVNSIWNGYEPVGQELHPMEVARTAVVARYWLDCLVVNNEEDPIVRLKPAELEFNLVVMVDPVTSSLQVQLTAPCNATWSSQYHASLTPLDIREPHYQLRPLSQSQQPDGRYGIYPRK
ncbi:hypothetical protein FA95DRAFT_1566828 [Auriscalpium vulgare]|uniref:Uncharacterized protein n=1 Tax=Auriscalpium vulgare TaxID=40419 RepID=A0ACB8R8Q4_9AGAM|nr:hypothetical protein FA95DRAFT_1566828 [Auriscalpium vulgare]